MSRQARPGLGLLFEGRLRVLGTGIVHDRLAVGRLNLWLRERWPGGCDNAEPDPADQLPARQCGTFVVVHCPAPSRSYFRPA
jgi:hypothetical protein